jgi:hypothetical protein
MTKRASSRAKSQSFFDDFASRINQLNLGAAIGSAVSWLQIFGPVYAISIALAVVYSWGWMQTFPGAFGVSLAIVVTATEILKPKLPDLLEDRIDEGTVRAAWKARMLLLAALACVAFGGISSFVAIEAAQSPGRAYAEGQRAVAAAGVAVSEARLALARFDCTTDMPTSRCEAFKRENGEAEARAVAAMRAAEHEQVNARRLAAPAPTTAVPDLPLGVKLLFGLGVDFVLFVTPWARRADRVTVPAKPVTKNVNTGGWETRRAKYGPNGQKKKPKLRMVRGGKS